jgi:membrane protein
VKFGLGAAFALTWKIVQWPIVLAFVLLGFALIYYFAPDARDQDWKWITPGSVAGVTLWLLVSFAFKTYLTFFNSYSATYGSLGAVIILMLWFYFTGAAILVGGEINSEVENAMARRGAPAAKSRDASAPPTRARKLPTPARKSAPAHTPRTVASRAWTATKRASASVSSPSSWVPGRSQKSASAAPRERRIDEAVASSQ